VAIKRHEVKYMQTATEKAIIAYRKAMSQHKTDKRMTRVVA